MPRARYTPLHNRRFNRPKTGTCNKCGGVGHWAKECTAKKQERANAVAEDEEWTGLLAIAWARCRTCMGANETFSEFAKVVPAQVTITVGGDNRLQCTTVGNLRIATENGSVELHEVRIEPGFGLSGPYLLTLSSDGKHWWARRRGRLVLKGAADEAGLYWAKSQDSKGDLTGNQGLQWILTVPRNLRHHSKMAGH